MRYFNENEVFSKLYQCPGLSLLFNTARGAHEMLGKGGNFILLKINEQEALLLPLLWLRVWFIRAGLRVLSVGIHTCFSFGPDRLQTLQTVSSRHQDWLARICWVWKPGAFSACSRCSFSFDFMSTTIINVLCFTFIFSSFPSWLSGNSSAVLLTFKAMPGIVRL